MIIRTGEETAREVLGHILTHQRDHAKRIVGLGHLIAAGRKVAMAGPPSCGPTAVLRVDGAARPWAYLEEAADTSIDDLRIPRKPPARALIPWAG